MTKIIRYETDGMEYTGTTPETWTEHDFLYEPENRMEILKIRLEIWKYVFSEWSKKDEVEEWFSQAVKLIFEDTDETKTS